MLGAGFTVLHEVDMMGTKDVRASCLRDVMLLFLSKWVPLALLLEVTSIGSPCCPPVPLSKTNNKKKRGTYPGKRRTIFPHAEEESSPITVVRYSQCLMESLCPWQRLHCSLYSCSGVGRCKAVWEVSEAKRRQELSGLHECITAFSCGWQACQWAVVCCRFT